MSNSFMGRCGADCQACLCRTSEGCPGCPATEGKPFWGECAVAVCCISKGHDHCGQCQDFPCTALKECSENGDNSDGVRMLEVWNEKGYDAWRREQNAQS